MPSVHRREKISSPIHFRLEPTSLIHLSTTELKDNRKCNVGGGSHNRSNLFDSQQTEICRFIMKEIRVI